jgi:hypothetical protein
MLEDVDPAPRLEPANARPGVQLHVLAMVAAILGIAYGVVICVVQLERVLDVFDGRPYAHEFLPAFGLGAAAIILACLDLVRTQRYKQPLLAVGAGLLAIAAPFIAGYVIAIMVIGIVAAVLMMLLAG